MSIPLVHVGPGWGVNEKLTSAQATALDVHATWALDKRSGQTDTLASAITVSSAGSITIGNGSNLIVASFGTATIQGSGGLVVNGSMTLQGTSTALGGSFTEFASTAELHFDAGSLITGSPAVQSGASLSFQSGATLTGASGSHFTLQSGATATIGCPVSIVAAVVTVNSASELHFSTGAIITGIAAVQSAAEINFASGGLISGLPKLKTGATLDIDTGSFLTLGGTETVQSTGAIDFASGGVITGAPKLQLASVFTIDGIISTSVLGSSVWDGSSVFNGVTTLAGTNAISGSTTISAPVALSGSGAIMSLRRAVLGTTTGTASLNITSADVWQVQPGLTGNVVINPTVGAGIPDGAIAKFTRQTNPGGGGITAFSFSLNDGLGNLILSFLASTASSGQVIYNATRGAWDTLDL